MSYDIMQNKKLFLLFAILCMVITSATAKNQVFKLQIGDLLFQDLDCGVLCDGIGQVTYGVNKTYVSHVGMVETTSGKEAIIIEAIGSGVVETPLHTFLARSHDANNHPMVMVGRLNPQYQELIPSAVKYARQQLGKPYNASFSPDTDQSFYCSQLIYSAFASANQNNSIFGQNQMNFNDLISGQITPAWKEYFAELKAAPPQGKPGTNPGMMSRESSITIVYRYGNLRIHTN